MLIKNSEEIKRILQEKFDDRIQIFSKPNDDKNLISYFESEDKNENITGYLNGIYFELKPSNDSLSLMLYPQYSNLMCEDIKILFKLIDKKIMGKDCLLNYRNASSERINQWTDNKKLETTLINDFFCKLANGEIKDYIIKKSYSEEISEEINTIFSKPILKYFQLLSQNLITSNQEQNTKYQVSKVKFWKNSNNSSLPIADIYVDLLNDYKIKNFKLRHNFNNNLTIITTSISDENNELDSQFYSDLKPLITFGNQLSGNEILCSWEFFNNNNFLTNSNQIALAFVKDKVDAIYLLQSLNKNKFVENLKINPNYNEKYVKDFFQTLEKKKAQQSNKNSLECRA